MKTKDFSELVNSLRFSPLGFLKLFFKSNMSSDEADSWNPDHNEEDKKKPLILDFYDGFNIFSSLKMYWDDIERFEIDDEEFDFKDRSIVLVLKIEDVFNSNNKLRIRLDFPIPDEPCGECYISEYEEEEKIKIKKEAVNENNNSREEYRNEIEISATKGRRRNLILSVIVIIIASVWYLFSKHPEWLAQLTSLFK